MLQRLEQDVDGRSGRYARIARAIEYLSENYASQPSLEEAARVACLSPFHFQREFSELAGISPKSFVAALTLEEAKTRLGKGARVLDAALDAGLSGPSRLHDLCLKIEAMTPGEYAKGGAGLAIAYGFYASLFGLALVMATERGLCGLAFGDDEEAMLADMRSRWPKAHFVQDDGTTSAYAAQIFPTPDSPPPTWGRGPISDSGAVAGPSVRGGGPRKNNALPIELFGTPWQIKVWQALLAIPEGSVTTYRAVAETVCTARASRAVGAAVGRNPISLLIPCHRVLASSGALTGYHWGVTRKRAMLAFEAARTANA
jgi:AraC family transcriptional regulator of adaptative response/methylated-DNA-[protein]-cysteine methyltransferase